jgi:hypothetical protein
VDQRHTALAIIARVSSSCPGLIRIRPMTAYMALLLGQPASRRSTNSIVRRSL